MGMIPMTTIIDLGLGIGVEEVVVVMTRTTEKQTMSKLQWLVNLLPPSLHGNKRFHSRYR
jgi:hypothetical protein